MIQRLFVFLLIPLFFGCKEKRPAAQAALKTQEPEWIQLFNGKDLSGWEPKFMGYPLG